MKPPAAHLAAVALVGLAARAGFFWLQTQGDELFLVPVVDEISYLEAGQRLAGAGFGLDGLSLPFWQPPGYVFASALLWGLGAGLATIAVVQQALGVVNAVLVTLVSHAYAEGRHPRLALAAGVAYSCVPAILYYETKFLKPVWNIALLMGLMLLARRRASRPILALAGLLAGVLCLFEAYFLLLAAGMLVAYAQRTRWNAGIFAAAAALVILPVTALNSRAAGRLVPISGNGGINLFLGNNPDWVRTTNMLPGWEWERLTTRYAGALGLGGDVGGAASSALFLREVLDYLKDDPLGYAAGVATKAALVPSARELTRDNYWSFPPVLEAWSLLANALIAGLAFACTPFLARRAPPLFLGIVVIVAVNALFFPSTRYRMPAVPLVLAGSFVAADAWRARGRSRRALLGLAAAGVAATLAASALASRIVDYTGWRSARHLAIGRAYTKTRELARAQLHFEAALATRESLETTSQLALFRLYAQKDAAAAGALLSRAAALEPSYPDVHYHLGVVAERAGEPERAYAEFQRYVELRDRAGTTNAAYTEFMTHALRFSLEYQREHGLPGRARRTQRRLEALPSS